MRSDRTAARPGTAVATAKGPGSGGQSPPRSLAFLTPVVPLDNISQETQQTKPARPAHAGCVSEGRHDRCPTGGFQGDAHHGRGSAPQPGSGAPSQAPLPGKASEQPSRKSSHSRPQTGPSEGSACRAGLGGCLGTWVSGGLPPPPIPE